MPQSHSSKAHAYRRKAKSCDELVACALSDDDRNRLLRIRESYLSIAANEDWLDSLPPTPPAHAAAMTFSRH